MKIQAKQLSNLVEDCRELIKEYMEKNNLTINAMGVKCKIHPAQLHLFLSGKGGLNLTTMQKIGSIISKSTN